MNVLLSADPSVMLAVEFVCIYARMFPSPVFDISFYVHLVFEMFLSQWKQYDYTSIEVYKSEIKLENSIFVDYYIVLDWFVLCFHVEHINNYWLCFIETRLMLLQCYLC